MAVRQARVGDVLSANRTWITVEPSAEYVPIGVRAFGRGIFHYEPVRGAGLGRLRFYEVKPSSLVVSNIKAWEGAIATSGLLDTDTIASNRFLSYAPVDNAADVDFLRHYFLTDAGNEKLQRASPGSADRNRTLAASRFEDIVVPLPTLAEQQRIAGRLDSLTVSFYQAPTRALRDALIESAGAKGRIGEVAALQRRPVKVSREGVYPNFGLLNKARGAFSKPPVTGAETKYSHLYQVQAGQLIYSKLFGWEGAVAVVPEWADEWFVSSEFPTFDLDRRAVDPDYFSETLRWRGLAHQLAAATSGMGQRRQRVQIEQFESLEIPLPKLAVQQRIGKHLRRITEIERLIDRRTAVGKALLPAARNEAFGMLN